MLTAATICAQATADTVKLTSGSVLSGDIQEWANGVLIVSVEGQTRRFPQTEVQSMHFTPSIPKDGVGPHHVMDIVDGDTVKIQIGEELATVRLIGVDTPETVDTRKPVQPYGRESAAFLRNMLMSESVWLVYEAGSTKDLYGRHLAYLYREPDGLFINAEIVRQGYGHAYTKYPFSHMNDFRDLERKAREAGKGLWAFKDAVDATAEVVEATDSGSRGPTRFQRFPRPEIHADTNSPEPNPTAHAPEALPQAGHSPSQSPQHSDSPSPRQGFSSPPPETSAINMVSSPYVASSEQEPYHRLSCRHAKKIDPSTLQSYSTKQAAVEAGHRPCKVCKP